MAIPISNTTVSVLRFLTDQTVAEPYDTQASSPTGRSVIATGIRAVISVSGSEQTHGGEQVSYTGSLVCDPTDLAHTDLILDEVTGWYWEVTAPNALQGFGLDHIESGLRRAVGLA